MLLLASRMPVSMASLFCSDSVNPFRNSSSYKQRNPNKFIKGSSLKERRALFGSRHTLNGQAGTQSVKATLLSTLSHVPTVNKPAAV